jgi:hypothetical protein
LQRLKSPMRYICEIFGAPRFSSFSTQSIHSRLSTIEFPVHQIAGRDGPCASVSRTAANAAAALSGRAFS